MKKFLTIALAAFAFIACNDNNIDDVSGGGVTGEMETSYIAINLNAADNTRAEGDPVFEDGEDAERAVNAAYFFFFDAEGNAFPVTGGSPATAPGGKVNWISANLTDNDTEETLTYVSDIKNAVLVLSTYKGQYPAQIVAVLNWPPQVDTAYDLDDLYAATNIIDASGGFVMSNAVYANGTNAVVGTPITAADIHKDKDEALDNPITIHVERIAAKVTVTANGVADNRFKVTKTATIKDEATDVYVLVTGWELHNDFTQSSLLKVIDPTWDANVLGFTWNDSPFYRSYWAKSLTKDEIKNNDFPETFGLKLGSVANVTAGTYAENTYTYVGENTLYNVTTNDGVTTKNTADCTKVIIKAKLQKKNDDGTFEDLKLARWYATYYADLDDLLTAVANTIKYQYYWYDEPNKKYVYIAPEDLTVVKEDKDNMVKFVLSNPALVKNWYVNAAGGYVSKTHAEINALLANIEKALYYDEAETLYYVDVAHLGYANPGDHVGDYGVVRNHIYNVVLNSFGGFGSPVYVPGGNLEYPDDPTDVKDYVSAEVRILSWRLVSQEVDVQP